ncbi:MAG: class I SAM-dependent methyltransferase [Candidatus Scalindua sp.]
MPSEEDLQELYQNNQFWGDTTKRLITPKNCPVSFLLAETRWSLLVSHVPEWDKEVVINILDIGAGQGCLGMVAKAYLPEYEINYTAVEPDSLMRASLEESWKNVDSKVRLSLYGSLDGIKQRFHIIVLSHVLEHVSNPIEFLKNLHGFLEWDGLLFVDVPNRDHLFKKSVFPHLLFFSPESLSAVLGNSGYVTTTVGSWGRKRESTPMSGSDFSFHHILEEILWKVRKIIPLRGLMAYFTWSYGIKKAHHQGTWVRAIGKLK